MKTYTYIEMSDDGRDIEKVIQRTTDAEMVRALRQWFTKMFKGDPDTQDVVGKLRRATTLEEIGEAVDYTQGWGENDMKTGHLFWGDPAFMATKTQTIW